MTRVLICLIAILTAGTAMAELSIGQVVKMEQKALSRLSAERINDVLNRPVSAGGIEYSRKWIESLPTATGDKQWECLSEALYFEARGESVQGQFAVAEVILNRVDSPKFPDTVCKVINQGTGRKYACQFTYTCDGLKEVIHERRAYDRVAKIAKLMLNGAPRALTKGATYYHTTAVNPRWSRKFPRTAKIGVHLFYRNPQELVLN